LEEQKAGHNLRPRSLTNVIGNDALFDQIKDPKDEREKPVTHLPRLG
jgi:hypothetical protein